MHTTIRHSVPPWKLWLMRFIAVAVIPAAIIAALEIALRIAGSGYPTSVLIPAESGEAPGYRDNLYFGWRFFAPELAREFTPFRLRADKGPNTYRIFVLGASAAQGVPEYAFSMGRILEVRLKRAYPGVDFDVITAAMTAINSHVVVDIAAECAGHDPDLFVIYLGNNEVVGPYGAGTVFSPLSPSLTVIRAGKWIKTMRLGQLLSRAIESVAGGGARPRVWRGLALFLDKQVPADAPGLEIVYEHFRSNLNDIIEDAAGSGAAVVCCTVATNLNDCPPFASQHRADIDEAERARWEVLYREGAAAETQDPAGAANRFLAAAAIDDAYADLHFRLGRCYAAVGAMDEALRSYIRARDLDTLRFRADTRINGIIREVAADWREEGVVLADVESALGECSPHGIPGRELFYEHVHMTFSGNDAAARAVLDAIERVLPQWIRDQKSRAYVPPGEAEVAAELAFNDWARRRIHAKIFQALSSDAPFTNQLYQKERIGLMRAELRQIEARLTARAMEETETSFRRLLAARPDDWLLREKYAQFLFEDKKDAAAAAAEYGQITARVPHNYHAWADLARLQATGGDYEKAISSCRTALAYQPYSDQARYVMGLSFQMAGRPNEAIEAYEQLLEIHPRNGPAWNNLGGVLYGAGRVEEATAAYRRGIELVPENGELHFNLGVLYRNTGRLREAAAEFQAVLNLKPDSIKARTALEAVRAQAKEAPAALHDEPN